MAETYEFDLDDSFEYGFSAALRDAYHLIKDEEDETPGEDDGAEESPTPVLDADVFDVLGLCMEDETPEDEVDDGADESPTPVLDAYAYDLLGSSISNTEQNNNFMLDFEIWRDEQLEREEDFWSHICDEESTVDYSRLTSFLEVDDSFLSPWNWDPRDLADDKDNSSDEGDHGRMNFQPGSFFSHRMSKITFSIWSVKNPSDPSPSS